MKLPVFKVASTVAPAECVHDLAKQLFPREDYAVRESGPQVEVISRLGSIEVDVARGGVWGADMSRLWQFDPANERDRRFMGRAESERKAHQLLDKNGVLPEVVAPFRLKKWRTTGSKTAVVRDKGASRRVTQEDVTVLGDIEVVTTGFDLKQNSLPIVGGGGRFGVVFGDGGQPVAVRGVWRPSVGRPELYEVIEQAKADEIFRQMTAGVPVTEFSSELAYYSAPAFSEQNVLQPVYVYSANAEYNGQRVPLRRVMIAATEAGPFPSPSPKQSIRNRTAKPQVISLPADFRPGPGQPLPPGVAVNRRLLRKAGLKLSDLFVVDTSGRPVLIRPDISKIKIKELMNLLGFYSAGTSWIGLSGGLGGSQNNAQGFVNEMAAAGWSIRFNWGDANAWESDWHKFDDNWVDAVDFVFYTGHANSDGWVLATPDDTFLHFSETSGAHDLWGANNLEWAVVAACGPLQDEVVGSGGDVLDRWREAFDGLHLLMGYAQITYDNEEEGKRLAKYSKAGATIMQSWFRTGQEIQPQDIWVGAYYLGNASGSTGGDHIWGVGSVGPDITAPTWRACSWVPC